MLGHKKLFGMLVAAAFAMLLGGCGGPEDSEFSAEGEIVAADISSEENSAAQETPQDSNLPVAVSLSEEDRRLP